MTNFLSSKVAIWLLIFYFFVFVVYSIATGFYFLTALMLFDIVLFSLLLRDEYKKSE